MNIFHLEMKPLSTLFTTLVALILISLSSPAVAEKAWYRVEVLVFENKDYSALHTEFWPDNPGKPEGLRPMELAVTDNSDITQSKGWEVLPPKGYELNNRAYALKKNRRYRLLLHTAWFQPAQESGQTKAVYLHDYLPIPYLKDRFPPRAGAMGPFHQQLFGLMRLRISRYLHVDLDLTYRIPQEVQYNAQRDALMETITLAPEDNRFVFTSEPVTTVAQRSYRLRESRRIKSKEVHYFDHPLFGVLLYVKPLKTGD